MPIDAAPAAGDVYILSAPSGAGKTSLAKALLQQLNEAETSTAFSVSCTTRAKRPGEVDGRDYHFLDHDEFRRRVDAGDFLEHARVFDNLYGTAQSDVEAQRAAGMDVILEIDWQGARQVRARIDDAVSIFVLPPSLEALASRLRGRESDSESVIERRMRDAHTEMAHYDEFDYLIVNDDFDTALAELRAIFTARRQALRRQRARHAALLGELDLG